jgi:hypothetical protein
MTSPATTKPCGLCRTTTYDAACVTASGRHWASLDGDDSPMPAALAAALTAHEHWTSKQAALMAAVNAARAAQCAEDHEQLSYRGHSDCLDGHKDTGPYHWIVYTWSCRGCGLDFAWMLAAPARDADGGWSGSTVKGTVFHVPNA